MAEKDSVLKGKVEQTGIFHFKDFYKFTYDWLRNDGYSVTEEGYEEKIAGDSKDVEIKWKAEKKVSDYFKFQINVDWRILRMTVVKVKKEGREINMNSGYITLKFAAVLIKDYENRWEDHPFWKFLRGLYDRYIVRSRIEDYEDKLADELEEFIAQCKSFLTLEGQH